MRNLMTTARHVSPYRAHDILYYSARELCVDIALSEVCVQCSAG